MRFLSLRREGRSVGGRDGGGGGGSDGVWRVVHGRRIHRIRVIDSGGGWPWPSTSLQIHSV